MHYCYENLIFYAGLKHINNNTTIFLKKYIFNDSLTQSI